MDRSKILNNSIILLGPKQVGKTTLAEVLATNKNLPDLVISSDLLTSLIVFDISENWNTLVVGSEIEEIANQYKSLFKFKELAPLVEQIAKIHTSNFSQKSKKVCISYWKARLLEDAIEQLQQPFILDAGADIGAVFNLSNSEENQIAQAFYIPFDFIKNRIKSLIREFKTRIYLKPGNNYSEVIGRAQDEENSLFMENQKSYTSFANHEISCDDLYNNGKDRSENFSKVSEEIMCLHTNQIPAMD